MPKREFLDAAELMPMYNVVLFGGDGATGKSLLALQLALACSTATNWLGIAMAAGPVLYVSAEDDKTEITIRLREIAAAEGIELSEAWTLNIIDLTADDAVLAVEDKKLNRMVTTPLYDAISRRMGELDPVVAIFDNLADTFSGNENNRSLVKQFVAMLRRLAIRHECCIILLGHPSVAGRASGTGESGSTAWNNSVRSRLYLHRVLGEDGRSEKDETLRELQTMKANYTAKGAPLTLQWQDGRFVRVAKLDQFEGVPAGFYKTVQEAFRGKRYREHQLSLQWGGYVIAELLETDAGRGITLKQCTSDQRAERNRITRLLNAMVKSKALIIVRDTGPDRHTTNFYEAGPTT